MFDAGQVALYVRSYHSGFMASRLFFVICLKLVMSISFCVLTGYLFNAMMNAGSVIVYGNDNNPDFISTSK
jgi:hypothetical protein